jgi:hypothetical protein
MFAGITTDCSAVIEMYSASRGDCHGVSMQVESRTVPAINGTPYKTLGTNTFSQNENNWESPSPKCIGYSDASQNSPQATNFSILKPMWTYGIQLWGTASTSNIEILERSNRKPCA